MTDRQLLLRIKSILIARKWLDSGDRVFAPGSVLTTQWPQNEAWARLIPPIAIIKVGGGTRDPEHGEASDLLSQQVSIVVITAERGDRFGEAALVGAHRSSKTTGRGRGILEVQEEVLTALDYLSAKDGVYVRLVGVGPAAPEIVDALGYVVSRELRFEARVTTMATYHRPLSVATSVAGSNVTLSWTAPDDTTDLISYTVRRVSGAQPVAFRSDGTDVALGSPLDVSVVDTPGSGTWTYSVFAGYADPGGSVANNFSDYGWATGEVA